MLEDTIFIIGDARTQEDNPITYRYKRFFIAFVVEFKTGKIIKTECSTTLNLTNEFLNSIFNEKILDKDINVIEEEIEKRYFGSSKKAVIVALKDAVKKYCSIKDNNC